MVRSTTIDALESSSGFFLMFTDSTNKTETYQAGRYMIIDPPTEDGLVTLDFNKAYNPPCAFNPLYNVPASTTSEPA